MGRGGMVRWHLQHNYLKGDKCRADYLGAQLAVDVGNPDILQSGTPFCLPRHGFSCPGWAVLLLPWWSKDQRGAEGAMVIQHLPSQVPSFGQTEGFLTS